MPAHWVSGMLTLFLDNPIIIVPIMGILAVAAYFWVVEEMVVPSFTMSPGSFNLFNRNREIPFPAKGKAGTSQHIS